MKRRLPALAALVAGALFGGCSMCQSPWDYCGPVAGPNGCPNCNFGARSMSLFAPMEGDPRAATSAPTPAERHYDEGSREDVRPPEPTPDSSPFDTSPLDTTALDPDTTTQ